jgi:DNA-binding transcriptional LysR family regulator
MHRRFIDRRLDILIGWKVGPLADARLSFDVLYDDSHLVVAGAASRRRKRRKIALADLMDDSWLLRCRTALPGPSSCGRFGRTGSIGHARQW